ncbi:MAG TPA: hypothetical protein VND93_32380 [Myxococcales bacterium]|nr:hypothetical protein [Myxococcales bacterium]
MREQLEKRLEELRAEYEKGKQTLEELEGKASNVRAMMLRLSGAMQVLQEMLEKPRQDGEGSSN